MTTEETNIDETTDTRVTSKLEDGIGICLSGGGYRAMLYHVGALWRLNEVGLLTKAARISSVSGGSITAAWLGLVWARDHWPTYGTPVDSREFERLFAGPILNLARQRIDVPSLLLGALPYTPVGEQVAKRYGKHLFPGATLQSLPDQPRFVINATNLQTGNLWRFSKPYSGDYEVGAIKSPGNPLATAVAASSAFPPFLSPLRLRLQPNQLEPWPETRDSSAPDKALTHTPILADGGVYDNLGLETVIKRYRTVLVSDGGGLLPTKRKIAGFWSLQMHRVIFCIDNQVRALRKRHLIENYRRGDRSGCCWGIGTNPESYAVRPLPCDEKNASDLAKVRTCLWKPDQPTRISRLSHVTDSLPGFARTTTARPATEPRRRYFDQSNQATHYEQRHYYRQNRQFSHVTHRGSAAPQGRDLDGRLHPQIS